MSLKGLLSLREADSRVLSYAAARAGREDDGTRAFGRPHELPSVCDAPVVCSSQSVVLLLDPGPAGLADRQSICDRASRALETYLSDRGAPDAAVRSLPSPFAVAILDVHARRAYLAVDRTGQSSLYLAVRSGILYFAARLPRLLEMMPERPAVSGQAIHDYVYFHCIPAPASMLEDVRKVERATLLAVSIEGVRPTKYWMPVFHSGSRRTRLEDKIPELRATLGTAVRRFCGAGELPGAFLSGGLDSSSVVGMLAGVAEGAPVRAFSMGFAAEGYDEIAYARTAAARFGVNHTVHYVSPQDITDCVAEVAAAFDEPFGNSSALPTYVCARVARDAGVRSLLAGDGGDELFGGNERYATQLLFERFNRVARMPGSLAHQLLQQMPGRLKPWPLGKVERFLAQAGTPLPDRLQTYNFLHQIRATEVFTESFVRELDLVSPLTQLRAAFAEPAEADVLDRMLYLDWKFTLADNDLVKVNTACRLAGVNVAFPMLADEVVDFSCTLPPAWKTRRRELRPLFKQAMTGFLPDEIITKPKHGFGLPFGVWTREHGALRELAYDSVLSLKPRGWFKPEFLDRVIKLHAGGHAAYYGELVWILMTLDIWLRSRTPPSSPG